MTRRSPTCSTTTAICCLPLTWSKQRRVAPFASRRRASPSTMAGSCRQRRRPPPPLHPSRRASAAGPSSHATWPSTSRTGSLTWRAPSRRRCAAPRSLRSSFPIASSHPSLVPFISSSSSPRAMRRRSSSRTCARGGQSCPMIGVACPMVSTACRSCASLYRHSTKRRSAASLAPTGVSTSATLPCSVVRWRRPVSAGSITQAPRLRSSFSPLSSSITRPRCSRPRAPRTPMRRFACSLRSTAEPVSFGPQARRLLVARSQFGSTLSRTLPSRTSTTATPTVTRGCLHGSMI
mmetsp:Transcript_29024/g.88973  ORF Transcript_29024/g.88973 Transcript_29024/m.88973 type:complete len:292 (-) Transcript_29024:292-1167(-)